MISATCTIPQLSSSELAAYQRDGFHIARGVLTPDEVAGLRDGFTDLAAGGPVPGLADAAHRLDPSEPLAKWPRLLLPHRHPDLAVGRLSLQLLLDERILAPLAQLCGEPVHAAQSMFYFKPPGARGQDLHQDAFYLRSEPGTCLAAWMAVDPVDDENGGLRVVPGSHRLPLLPVRPTDKARYFADDAVDLPTGIQAVPTEMAPGDVLFFNGQVIHGSGPNRSADRFRRSFICHYVPASTTAINPWNRPVIDRDGREVPVAVAAQGPWQDGFGRSGLH